MKMNISNLTAILCAAVCVTLSAPQRANAATPVDLPTWEGKQSADGWKFSDPAAIKVTPAGTDPSILIVTTAASAVVTQCGASIGLPIAAVSGSHIEVSVDIRAKDVTKPEHSYNGIKAMVHVVSPKSSETWDQANANGGAFPINYDWKTFSFRTSVPADATVATLILGLQDSTGSVDFRNLHVVALRKIAVLPAHPVGGPLYTGHGSCALRGVMVSPRLTSADIDVLHSWNVNQIRFQLLWNSFPMSPADTSTVAEYNTWLASCLEHLDSLMPDLKKAGISVVVDVHTPPGGRTAAKVHRIFTDATFQQAFIDDWKLIAKRYKDNKQVWGYDLVNEPVLGPSIAGVLDWHDLAEATAKEIRRIDADHAIIVEPDPWGNVGSLYGFEPINVPKVVYSVHMYDPGSFTHQGVLDGLPTGPAYPGVIEGKMWDKDQIRKRFQPVAEFAKAYNVQVYVGEFSAVRWGKGADQYVKDVIDVMEEHNWDWSYHAFREWQGWSPEVGEDKAVTTPSPTPTARLLVLQAAFAKNGVSTKQVAGAK